MLFSFGDFHQLASEQHSNAQFDGRNKWELGVLKLVINAKDICTSSVRYAALEILTWESRLVDSLNQTLVP